MSTGGVRFTRFPNEYAKSKRELEKTLPELAELIRKTTGYHKKLLPWIKLARFGEQRSEGNSLRFNDNMLEIFGIELDYDLEKLTIEEAAAIAEKANLRALLYTSASYKPEAPRWRMLCPTSTSLPPEDRAHLVARVNGLYGGVFADESFTLSTSYYYGSVKKNPAHKVILTEGKFIDRCDQLDACARWKNGKDQAPAVKVHDNVTHHDPHDSYFKYANEILRPLSKVAAALRAHPNNICSSDAYDHFIEIGHSVAWAYPGDDGEEVYVEWSRTWPGYRDSKGEHKFNEAYTRKKFKSFHPRGKITIATLFHFADQDTPSWRDAYEAEQQEREWEPEPEQPKTQSAETHPKGEPVDLWGQPKAPPLPRGLLPEAIEKFAFEQGAVMGGDPAGLAMGALTVCAVVIPDSIELQVRKYDRSFKQSARLWVGLVGGPSEMKTPILKQCTRRLLQLEAELYRKFLQAMREYEETPKDKRTGEEPIRERLTVEDTTPESLQPILQGNPNGVLCYRDELSGWFGSMDQYKGHRGSERSLWLRAYDGGVYSWDRSSRGSGLIENLSISVLGGIQPEPLVKLVADGVDDGLIQRLLVIMLRPRVMGQDVKSDASERFDALVEHLHNRLGGSCWGDLQFDDGAQLIQRELEQKHLELTMAYSGINKKLASHIGKYDGLFARLCIIWHCIENWPGNIAAETARWLGHISAETARRVADFMHQFLLPHAVAFYVGILGLADQHDRLTAVAGYILAHKLEKISVRDVQRGIHDMRNLDRRSIQNLFEYLETLGWIDLKFGRRAGDPLVGVVNPEVHTQFAKRGEEEVEHRRKVRQLIAETVAAGHATLTRSGKAS